MKFNYEPLGNLIEISETKNKDLAVTNLVGMNINKKFIPSVANTIGTNLARYKLIHKNQFACNLMHVGRDKSVVISLFNTEKPAIISPAYKVFEIKNEEIILPKFLMMYFHRSEFDRLGWFYTDSSIRGSLDWTKFCDIKIPIPKLEIQKKIVEIYEFLNYRIELKERINQNLENLVMSIFISWFVKFENYDRSNGMITDESFGDIPKSWSVEMLEDYVDFVTGVEPGSKNYHEKPIVNDIPFLRVGDLGSRANVIFIDESLSKKKILKHEDIVLSLDATIGIVKMGLEGAYSTGMRKLVIKNDNINKAFLYCLVKSEHIQRIIKTFATGTTILHAGKSIKHMNFVLSDINTMNKFGEIGNPIMSIILSNLKEIEKLTNLRDILLPKLMSGDIDVRKINSYLE